MKVTLKCFANLAESETCGYKDDTTYSLNEGQTVADLASDAGLVNEDIKIAFVNNRMVPLDTALADGDRVGLAPATGGM